jgi:hypothetical protein
MNEQFVEDLKRDTIAGFESYRKMAERALAQVSDEDFFRIPGDESNSIAAIYKHVGGNLRSRWTDFLTTDGEKADRDRDSEFVAEGDTRDSLNQLWEKGWNAALSALESMSAEDFLKTVTIRGEPFNVPNAILRSLSHTASHVGQIVLLAKLFAGNAWQTLSVPRGKSAEFNQFIGEKKTDAHFLDAPHEFSKLK